MAEVYVVYHKLSGEIENSSSGAIFVALSNYILDKNRKIIGGGITM